MDFKQRNKRLRLLIKRLNRDRKRQAKKIDILCNDLIAAQRDFIRRLETISCAAQFYKTLLGTTHLNNLLETAAGLTQSQIPGASVSFFLRQPNGFERHTYQSDNLAPMDGQRVEACLGAEVVDSICKANKTCTLEEMLAMGLDASPAQLSRISAVTVPIGQFGRPTGFIFLCKRDPTGFTVEELATASSLASGLSRAVPTCQVPSRPSA